MQCDFPRWAENIFLALETPDSDPGAKEGKMKKAPKSNVPDVQATNAREQKLLEIQRRVVRNVKLKDVKRAIKDADSAVAAARAHATKLRLGPPPETTFTISTGLWSPPKSRTDQRSEESETRKKPGQTRRRPPSI